MKAFNRYVQQPFARGKSTGVPKSSFRKPIMSASTRLIPASPAQRFRSLVFDVPRMLGCTIVTFLVALPISPFGIQGLINSTNSPYTSDIVPIYLYLIKVALLSPILVTMLSLKKRGITSGMQRASLRVVSTWGASPSAAQIMIRALVAPLSLVIAPFSILLAGRTISELASRTLLTRRI
jgi:uncharacterized RDD family membrane protein YckC